MPLIQSAAFDAVADRHDPRGAGLALDSVDAGVRRAAVREIDMSIEAALLVARLGVEPDRDIRELIVDRLVATRNIEMARPLLALIRSHDIALRNAIIAALPMLGEALVPELRPLLNDGDPAVRIAAINLLQGMRGQAAIDLAVGIVADDPHVNVCAAAVDVLAEAAGPDAIAPLQALARRFPDVPFIAFAIAAALERIG
jgi:HEAT repeat protein